MTLELHSHPLSQYCQKALIALYENETPFEHKLLDLGNEAERTRFRKLWPIGKMPVLRDSARNETVVESATIVEYLAIHYPGRVALVPADPDAALKARTSARFYDLYVSDAVAKIVTDKLRPAGKSDAFGVEEAKTLLRTAYGVIEEEMATRTWAMGDAFTMADCAAAPGLFYANKLIPFDGYKNIVTYYGRLLERPSFARVLREAEPYFALFPG